MLRVSYKVTTTFILVINCRRILKNIDRKFRIFLLLRMGHIFNLKFLTRSKLKLSIKFRFKIFLTLSDQVNFKVQHEICIRIISSVCQVFRSVVCVDSLPVNLKIVWFVSRLYAALIINFSSLMMGPTPN